MHFRASKNWNRIIFIIVIFTFPAWSQERWEWPEHPLNIKVLPTDLSAAELRSAMFEFTQGLGVRCNYCHTGEEGKPLSTYDFAADENPNKERTREMIRMLASVDEHLAKIQPSGDMRVNMMCYTCHRGRPRPMTLEEEIGEVYRKNGLEPAIAHMSELKKEYYGKGVYNFESDQVLNQFGQTLLDNNNAAEAIQVFQLNVEKFPESARAWNGLAEAHMKAANKAEAIKYFEKSLELNPRNRNAREMLDQLKK